MASRDQLIERMQRYLTQVLARDAAPLARSPDVQVTENGESIVFGAGLFETIESIGFRQYFADTTAQQVGFFGTLQTSAGPRILALRLGFHGEVITQSEAIIAREGGHLLFAPRALREPLPIYEQTLHAEARAPRAELIAIANLYFDAIERANGDIAPFHPSCGRRENGVLTTNNPPHFPVGCKESIAHFKHIPRVRERRFPIVDEERGLVWALVMFDMPSQNRSMRLAELFKIIDGQIREIEAVLINTPLGATAGWISDPVL